jgi:glutamate---cysteine ligase / carboxylate-amine ligase
VGMLLSRSGGADPRHSPDGAVLSTVSRTSAVPEGILLTFGVEEEFLLADMATRATVPRAPAVLRSAAARFGHAQVQSELFPTQVEIASKPCTELAELRADLGRLRSGIADAAREAGCRPVASGTAVLPAAELPEVTDNPRYRRLADTFGPIAQAQGEGVCGCHVHVGIADRDEAIQVGNHLRGWLPTLEALAANSPFRWGHDSGYASSRALCWSQWPTAGPSPWFSSAKAYDDLIDALVDSGMLIDRKAVYWYARLSEHLPTLEIRVADVNADLDTVMLIAALVRGLAGTLLAEVRVGRPAPVLPEELLRAAHWRAAREGLGGLGLDLATGRLRPAWELLDLLVDRAAPGLEAAGDRGTVLKLLEDLRRLGGGTARQRAAHARRGELSDVVDELASATAAD